ncbi:hypothetical protein IMCC20628_04583 [Hoeflea sp. IMCC20628]|uniref:hypothetical protein n=1 Tax=Hoeflea sp. IMCC20628 TaxID=1620421 RepID=UPI00063B06D6|nr:hypothetical protein [Hoeflea sp. IMCC20628]AKI03252.1 hypothetical protein IMCC20628_04583 [Hoeflea sp. IMCC20628]
MFAGLSSDMVLYFVALSIAASFFVGNAMNSVLGEQGFGVWGNMIVLLAGFCVGLNVVDAIPFGRVPSAMIIPAAIAVSFAILFILAILKRMVRPT